MKLRLGTMERRLHWLEIKQRQLENQGAPAASQGVPAANPHIYEAVGVTVQTSNAVTNALDETTGRTTHKLQDAADMGGGSDVAEVLRSLAHALEEDASLQRAASVLIDIGKVAEKIDQEKVHQAVYGPHGVEIMIRDIVVLRCLASIDPMDREAFIGALECVFGGKLHRDFNALLCLAHKKVCNKWGIKTFKSTAEKKGHPRVRKGTKGGERGTSAQEECDGEAAQDGGGGHTQALAASSSNGPLAYEVPRPAFAPLPETLSTNDKFLLLFGLNGVLFWRDFELPVDPSGGEIVELQHIKSVVMSIRPGAETLLESLLSATGCELAFVSNMGKKYCIPLTEKLLQEATSRHWTLEKHDTAPCWVSDSHPQERFYVLSRVPESASGVKNLESVWETLHDRGLGWYTEQNTRLLDKYKDDASCSDVVHVVPPWKPHWTHCSDLDPDLSRRLLQGLGARPTHDGMSCDVSADPMCESFFAGWPQDAPWACDQDPWHLAKPMATWDECAWATWESELTSATWASQSASATWASQCPWESHVLGQADGLRRILEGSEEEEESEDEEEGFLV